MTFKNFSSSKNKDKPNVNLGLLDKYIFDFSQSQNSLELSNAIREIDKKFKCSAQLPQKVYRVWQFEYKSFYDKALKEGFCIRPEQYILSYSKNINSLGTVIASTGKKKNNKYFIITEYFIKENDIGIDVNEYVDIQTKSRYGAEEEIILLTQPGSTISPESIYFSGKHKDLWFGDNLETIIKKSGKK